MSSYSSQFMKIHNDIDRMLCAMITLKDKHIDRALAVAQGQILLAKKLFQAKINSSEKYLELVIAEKL